MLKRFIRNLSHSYCIYILAIANVVYALQKNSFDWLLWLSVALSVLSILLNLICAIRKEETHA